MNRPIINENNNKSRGNSAKRSTVQGALKPSINKLLDSVATHVKDLSPTSKASFPLQIPSNNNGNDRLKCVSKHQITHIINIFELTLYQESVHDAVSSSFFFPLLAVLPIFNHPAAHASFSHFLLYD